jgi:hypothetical protein
VSKIKKVLALAVALASLTTWGAEPSPEQFEQLFKQLMTETKVTARMGITSSVKDFKSDGNPNTLEIVFLESSVPGANTVSEDGEVVFLYEASNELQSKLIGQAFQIRTKLRLKGA